MATFTASAAQPDQVAKGLRVGLSGVAALYDNTTVSLSINTNINMVKLPASSRVLFMSYGFDGIGDGTWQIGDTLNGTRYVSVATLSAGLGMQMAKTFSEYVYSVEDTIVVRCSLSSATTLGGQFHLKVIYGLDTGN